jgi:Transposase DDE domain
VNKDKKEGGDWRRWVAERTFAWRTHNRRMSKDCERLCSTGEAFVYATMTRLMLRRRVLELLLTRSHDIRCKEELRAKTRNIRMDLQR